MRARDILFRRTTRSWASRAFARRSGRYGHREVWRFAFDPVTGDLWEGDIGQDLYEEVNIIRKGENYGWNVFEGFERFSNKYRREGEKYVPPVFAYTRKYGQSVTGGYVYRGNPKSSFYGVYIFGDYQQKRLFAMTQKDRVLDKVRVLTKTPQSVVSMGQDAKGNIYLRRIRREHLQAGFGVEPVRVVSARPSLRDRGA